MSNLNKCCFCASQAAGRTRPSILFFALLWITTTVVLPTAPSLLASDKPTLNEISRTMASMRTQVEIGEFENVADSLDAYIEDWREQFGAVDMRLAEPYMLLGDAQMGMNESEDALESFNLALMITKVGRGLNSTDQVEALHRISAAHVDNGDYEKANVAQERAYALMLQQFGTDDPALLPSMFKLIDWYESNRRFIAAKILYIEAMGIARRMIPADDIKRIELARAFAKAMRNTVFPPTDDGGIFRPFGVQVPGYEPLFPAQRPPSSYVLGSTALQEVVGFTDKYHPDDLKRRAITKLNLADWHQLFGRETKAIRMYREIWDDLSVLGDLRSEIFDEPELLYIRLPNLEDTETDMDVGLVELLLTVSNRGLVTGRISQIVEPKNSHIEFRTRMAARDARFRPAFKEGRPVMTKGVLLTHRYPITKQRG